VNDRARLIAGAFSQLTTNINYLMFPGALWLLHLPLPFVRRLHAAQATLETVVGDLIRERRALGQDTGDLLSMLLLAEDADHPGEKLSDQEIRDQVMTLFFAGHETTANALTWTWWLLARHPKIESALHTELDQVLAGRTPTFSDLPKLVLTEQIVREVLRLYPPVWALGRQTVQTVELDGFKVPPGSLILASQWLIQRDARWYPEPLAFQPGRWTPEFKAALPRFAYFPFGGGARSCIGENFAWMEFILVVATLAQRWRFTPTPDSARVLPLARITLHPDRPVQLQIRRR
jgi:cytochrome P450